MSEELTIERLTAEVRAVLDALGPDAVRVRENGGPEDICASLAVSVRKLQERVEAQAAKLDEMRELLDLSEAVMTASIHYLPDDMAISARQRSRQIRAVLYPIF